MSFNNGYTPEGMPTKYFISTFMLSATMKTFRYKRPTYRNIRCFESVLILTIILVLSSMSCSRKQDIEKTLSEAFRLANEGKYDDAQIKALKIEEMLSDKASLKDQESLARLYGIIYYQQNITDKARNYSQQALRYSIEMEDTSLIVIDHFNLGLCAATSEEAISNFEQAAYLAGKSGSVPQQSSALEKMAQIYVSIGDFTKAQQLLDEANDLCEDNSIQQREIAVTQCRLWLAEGKSDIALQGYKSINPDSLNVYGRLLRTSAIYDILIQQCDYRKALAYKDSIYMYADSIKRLDGSKQVENIEREYHANITQKNHRFQVLMWFAILAVTIILIILFFVVKTLRLKKRQIELNDKIYVLNARIVELMPKSNEDDEHEEANEENIASVLRLIEQKYILSLEVFKNLPQYESLRKLNLIREMNSENKAEIKAVYDAIVGRFSGCCSDTRQAFPAMTNDDCVFCTMNFVGCSKEVISVSMGSSEDALRRRKSRIKQKLPESIFMFFFTK